MNFVQKENETFYQCWERFKDLLNSCPHHGYEIWCTINFFYEGLMSQMCQFVEMMCNGKFLNKDPNKAWEYFDHLAENGQPWDITASESSTKTKPPTTTSSGRIYQLREGDDLYARISSLTKKDETMELRKDNEIKSVQKEEVCSICEVSGHTTHECPTILAFKEVLHEQANAINTYKKPFNSPYFETYNPV
jgi:hypothetical protein